MTEAVPGRALEAVDAARDGDAMASYTGWRSVIVQRYVHELFMFVALPAQPLWSLFP